MFKCLAGFAVVLGLIGCSTSGPTQKPDAPISIAGYTHVEKPMTIQLPETVGVKRAAASWTEADTDTGLLPGTYVAKLEDSNGVLYYGEGRPNYFAAGGNYYLRAGGIWVPKTTHEPVKVFLVVNEGFHLTATSLSDAIAKQSLEAENSGHTGIMGALAMGQDGMVTIYTPLHDNAYSERLTSLVTPQLSSAAKSAP